MSNAQTIAGRLRWLFLGGLFVGCLFLGGLLLGGMVSQAAGNDFRMDNRVYAPDNKTSETVTLFHEHLVYDYLSDPPETTVYDPEKKRYVLLDRRRAVQLELDEVTVAQYIAQMREKARDHDQPGVDFLFQPQFTESTDKSSGELLLESKWLSYRVETVAPRYDSAAEDYARFADATAELNALLDPASLPPFGRLALNSAVRARGEMPVEVRLELRLAARQKPLKMRSEHTIAWKLTDQDLRRIESTRRQMDSFKTVTLDEFRRAPGGEDGGRRAEGGSRR